MPQNTFRLEREQMQGEILVTEKSSVAKRGRAVCGARRWNTPSCSTMSLRRNFDPLSPAALPVPSATAPPPRGPSVQADGTRPLGSPSPSLALRLPHRFYPRSDQLHALTLSVRTAPTFPRGSLRDTPGPACVLASPVHTAVSAGVRACQAFPAPGTFSTGAEMICRFYGSCSPPSQLVELRKCVKKDFEAESELSLKSRAGVGRLGGAVG